MTASSSSTLTLVSFTTSTSPSNYPSRRTYPNPKSKLPTSMSPWSRTPQPPMNFKSSSQWLIKKIKKLISNGFSPSKIINSPKTGSRPFKTTKTKNYKKPNKHKIKSKQLKRNKNPQSSINNLSIKHGFMTLWGLASWKYQKTHNLSNNPNLNHSKNHNLS